VIGDSPSTLYYREHYSLWLRQMTPDCGTFKI